MPPGEKENLPDNARLFNEKAGICRAGLVRRARIPDAQSEQGGKVSLKFIDLI